MWKILNNSEKRSFLIIFFLCLVAAAVSLSVFWALKNFAGLNAEELFYELRAPLKGTGAGLIKSYILSVSVPTLLISIAAVLFARMAYSKGFFEKYRNAAHTVCLSFLISSTIFFALQINLGSFLINNLTKTDYIKNHYVDPYQTSIEFPENKRNLIFIYLESMETSFADASKGGGLEENIIPELTSLAEENEDFSGASNELNGGLPMPGTTWTMGALFGASTGLPLKSALTENAMYSQEDFFPRIAAIGDILAEAGYRQVFQLGSDASFGGRNNFYNTHGGYEIRDYLYARDNGLIPSDYEVFWGYEDEKLFDFSKKTLEELSAGDQPFNMTILTVDTHMPSGYVCRLCKNEDDFQYFNTIACASRQVGEFIQWVKKQSFYNDTTIVIYGDHITMAGGVSERLLPDCIRKSYTCIINAANDVQESSRSREYTTFDLFPTTLGALGVKIDGEKLGLGTNLFSSVDTLSEEKGWKEEAEEIEKKSDFLYSMESYDERTEALISMFDKASEPEEITVSDDGSNLYVRTSDLTRYSEQATIKGVSIKLWYYTDSRRYIYGDGDLNQGEDGNWSGDFSLDKYQGAEEINYQLIVSVEGAPSIKLGKEGTVMLNK